MGDKAFFERGPKNFEEDGYTALNSGQVMQGQHFWSYKRRSARDSSTDGIYAVNDGIPQITLELIQLLAYQEKTMVVFW